MLNLSLTIEFSFFSFPLWFLLFLFRPYLSFFFVNYQNYSLLPGAFFSRLQLTVVQSMLPLGDNIHVVSGVRCQVSPVFVAVHVTWLMDIYLPTRKSHWMEWGHQGMFWYQSWLQPARLFSVQSTIVHSILGGWGANQVWAMRTKGASNWAQSVLMITKHASQRD